MGPQLGLRESIEVFPNTNFDLQVKQFIYACQDKSVRPAVLKIFRHHPLLKVHDIARAVYLLTALEEGKDLGLSFLKLEQEASGAVLLFARGGFPWKGLPYPAEHAELGLLLLQITEFYEEGRDVLTKMYQFQQSCFNHEGSIFPALWSQETSRSPQEKTDLSKSFFYQFDQQLSPEYTLIDPALGFWMQRSSSSSAFIAASGCKSSLGAYYSGDVGIVAYGPCSGDYSDCSGFGCCGIAKEFSCSTTDEEIHISFLSSLGMPHPRITGFSYLQDAYPRGHLLSQIRISETQCQVHSLMQELAVPLTFSLFCKGKHCQVVEGPRLRSESLDSYKGPTNDIMICGERGFIRVFSSGSYMEIFALQGNKKFWNSDFLISIPYQKNEVMLVFEKK
ncbi:hypothetical protein [Candidatus Chlamydia sanziniae]|nr:hypothetical protein [Candidatus Chlamydia sanziniae]